MEPLNYCYYNSDFEFSDESVKWIEDIYYHPLKDTFVPYDKYATPDTGKKLLSKRVSWEGTSAIKELRDYLKPWGVDASYIGTDLCGPDVFISNMPRPQLGYPHIDGYKWDDTNPDKRLPVLTRFNIVIKYNPDDSMFWWEDVVAGHPLVGAQDHTSEIGVRNYQYLAIKGNNGNEKWDNLGKPSAIKNGLYKNHRSAFLRTDCAHCVNIDNAGYRLVVALALPMTLAELYKNKGLIS